MTFYAHWKAGIVEKAFIKDTKDSSLNNFLRSILSLFQFQTTEGQAVETDITGTCNVKYITKSSTRFMKRKTDCKHESFHHHERADKPLGCDTLITRVNFIDTSADGFIESIHSSDYHNLYINAYKNVGFKTGSLFYLKLDQVKDCETIKAENFEDAFKTLDGYKETTLLPEMRGDSSEDANVNYFFHNFKKS